MKRITVVIACLVAAIGVNAQKITLSLNGGVASPTGAFSKGDYADEQSGFAKTGYHFNLSGVYKVSRSFGINALVGYSQFGHKGLSSLADGYKEDSGTDSTTLYSKGNNQSLSVLVGPAYFIQAGKKVTISVRALGGYVHTSLSGFQVFYEDYTDNAMTQKKASAGAFGFQAGLGIAYHITDKISIHANGDYFSSKPSFDIAYDNFVVNSGRRLSTYNQALSGINATIGVGFRLF